MANDLEMRMAWMLASLKAGLMASLMVSQ